MAAPVAGIFPHGDRLPAGRTAPALLLLSQPFICTPCLYGAQIGTHVHTAWGIGVGYLGIFLTALIGKAGAFVAEIIAMRTQAGHNRAVIAPAVLGESLATLTAHLLRLAIEMRCQFLLMLAAVFISPVYAAGSTIQPAAPDQITIEHGTPFARDPFRTGFERDVG